MLKVMYDILNYRKMYYLADVTEKDGVKNIRYLSGYGSQRDIEKLKEEREKHEQDNIRKC